MPDVSAFHVDVAGQACEVHLSHGVQGLRDAPGRLRHGHRVPMRRAKPAGRGPCSARAAARAARPPREWRGAGPPHSPLCATHCLHNTLASLDLYICSERLNIAYSLKGSLCMQYEVPCEHKRQRQRDVM